MSGSNAPQTMQLTGGYLNSVGNLAQNYALDVNSNPIFPLGMVVQGIDSIGSFGEYIFLKSVTGAVVGSAVLVDEVGTTALLTAGVNGPVAISLTIFDATAPYAWFGYTGSFPTKLAASVADDAQLGRDSTDGVLGDGFATGDQIQGAISRAATTGAAVALCQFSRPFAGVKTT